MHLFKKRAKRLKCALRSVTVSIGINFAEKELLSGLGREDHVPRLEIDDFSSVNALLRPLWCDYVEHPPIHQIANFQSYVKRNQPRKERESGQNVLSASAITAYVFGVWFCVVEPPLAIISSSSSRFFLEES